MNWLQIRLFGPEFISFSTNSYGYYSQMSQNLVSNIQTFASVLTVRRAANKMIKANGRLATFTCLSFVYEPVARRCNSPAENLANHYL